MAKLSLTLLLLACSSAMLAYGQDAGSDQAAAAEATPEYSRQSFVHPLTNMPGASEDVETSFIYPGYEWLWFLL
jgi:hypothetical protein